MKYVFLVIGSILTIGVTILAVNTPKQAIITEPTIEEKEETVLDHFTKDCSDYFDQQFEAAQIPGAAVVIIKDTTVLLMKGYGVRSVNSPLAVNNQTVFRLASLSKGMSAVLTGMMVMDGEINFEDKVIDYLPDFRLKSKQQTKDIAIRHILSHTTGMPYHAYTNAIEDGMELKDIAKKFKKQRLIGKPGEVYAYQNAIFSLIDPIAKEITGSSFDKVINGYMFDPLDMNQASATYEAIMLNNNIALPHKPSRDKQFKEVSITQKYYNAIPAGGINASIEDMSKYMQLLLGNHPDLLSEEILDQIFAPMVDMDNDRRYKRWKNMNEAHYAMGWRVLERQQDTIIQHSGYVNRYRSEIAINRKDKIAICVLSNAPNYFPEQCVRYFFDTWLKYQEKEPEITIEIPTS